MKASFNPIRVVLADDNADLISALCMRLNLESDIDCVGCTTDAHRVVDEAARHAADVLVIDLSMPGADIPSIIHQLQLIAPRLRTILYTGFPDSEIVDRALSAGASQMVFKDTGPEGLLAALRSSQLAIAS